ncbi:hypothetical protein LCGC14_2283090 [marine sediment metagenome]|uniref:Uncharacterized protein n=1 Tax=marine sediment metagenome TaxID=412755 RepID=A0A0F9FNQ8_9ZZZZ
MTDLTKKCWSCGSKNVKPVDTWFQCDDCGATHCPQTKPGHPSMTEVDLETGRAPQAGRSTRYRPYGLKGY